ncbi:MAG: nucleoside-diphosphate kinase, partial [Phocaeicola sp.]
MERTLVILKPSTVQRGLIGEIIARFERKGLRIVGTKMTRLTEEILEEHYAHLVGKSFFDGIKHSMMVTPVLVMCLEGVDAVDTVHALAGPTNSRKAQPGTI